MLFLATFFPTWEGGAGVYDFVGEFMKATVDLADLLGLHLVMSRNAGKGEYKIMVAAMGWATAELVMSRYILFLCPPTVSLSISLGAFQIHIHFSVDYSHSLPKLTSVVVSMFNCNGVSCI